MAVRDPGPAGLAGLFPVIFLFFTSSALVPVVTMPSWLQAFAKANPITVITCALRALRLGGRARPAIEATAWITALLAVTVPAVRVSGLLPDRAARRSQGCWTPCAGRST